MVEEFRDIPLHEFSHIRDSEIYILSNLRDSHRYLYDKHGDVIIRDNELVIDTSIIVTPNILSVPDTNIFASHINGFHIPDLIHVDTRNGYEDVFSIDRQMMSNTNISYIAKIRGYFIDGLYQGCIWYFTSDQYPEYMGVYGMRSSILNTLTGKRGVATKILHHLISSHISKTLIVPWPLYPMRIILERVGFTRHYISYRLDGMSREQAFLSEFATPYEFYTYTQ